jgi:hypothetical protein
MSCGLRDENDSGKRSLVRSRNERSHPDSSVELVGSTMNNRLRKRDTQAVPRQKSGTKTALTPLVVVYPLTLE